MIKSRIAPVKDLKSIELWVMPFILWLLKLCTGSGFESNALKRPSMQVMTYLFVQKSEISDVLFKTKTMLCFSGL